MDVWKLGCNWGAGKPYFDDLLRNEKIVFCWEHNFKIDDYVIIAKGFRIIALAKIIENKKQLIAHEEFNYIYDEYKIEFDKRIHFCRVEWYDLPIEYQFNYNVIRGICHVDDNEIVRKVKLLYKNQIDNNLNETQTANPEMNKVELHTKTLGQIFQISETKVNHLEFPLSIPDYQRIYCWTEKNVHKLLDDIIESENKTYHLGSVILHKTTRNVIINDQTTEDVEDVYSIVDGQQRLVTITLLLLELGNESSPLLNETFESTEAQAYIAYNKTLIKNYVERNRDKIKVDNLLDKLQFSVLIINAGSLDLAYTFFSNQNSRGKSLTDYELLKAHHLRFIKIDEQAEHIASRWDDIIIESKDDLSRTVGVYLYRLRKWMRKREWNENEKFKVKIEFEAVPIIPEIPPFGEQFNFYESIQGGTHFFAYAEHFIYKFRTFKETPVYKHIQVIGGESHGWYRDVIECLLFAYYLKFGTNYLNEAFICIEKIISEHRYNQSRSNLKYVLIYGRDSEIVMMIDQATSPTFFLAEAVNKITRLTPNNDELTGIRLRYKTKIKSIYESIDKTIQIESIKQLMK